MMVMGDKDPLVPYNGGNVGNLPGSKVLSAQDTIKFWASKNGCTANPSDSTLPDQDPADGTLVKREEYKSCRDNASVVLYTVQGGGHTWPGGLQYLPETTIGKTSRDFNASEEIWKFFNKANLK
jgi:polyhydroxybutyrate depolymerase